ncbi:tapasin-related protein-like isoform X2 [Heterodontus francisci]|uniref:tapasin-related protein-like isoform X2 n=1 Tax=Heterodontus francisci TaxID=7792 RepID=UPI00355AE026
MLVLDVLWYLSALDIIYTAAKETPLSVLQFPARLTPVKGENVSIYCSIPLFRPNAWVAVYWRRNGQDGTLDSETDKRKIMTPFKQGSAEFHLLNVTFQDSGVYYCSVRDLKGMISNGNGTELIVHVPPTPVTIFCPSSPSFTLLCTTTRFFPKEFNLTWYKNDVEITSGINITERRNQEGLYQVFSVLKPVKSGSVYTCQVSHVSLGLPANDSCTVPGQGNGIRSSLYPIVYGCAAGGLIILLLVIIIKRCKLSRIEGTEISEDIPGQVEEQTVLGGEAGSPSYAVLNISTHRKTGKSRREDERTVYAQYKQETDVQVAYASPDFTASQKTAIREQKKRRAEYAEIKISKPIGESEIA